MTNLADLIEEIRAKAIGYGTPQTEVLGTLADDINATQNTLTLASGTANDGSVFPAGPAEVGFEKIIIQQLPSSNLGTGVFRGVGRTAATAHAKGTMVTANPKFYRADIMREINRAISGMEPDLYQVNSVEFNGNNSRFYPLDESTLGVIAAATRSRNNNPVWQSLDTYNYVSQAGSLSPTTGKGIAVPYTLNSQVILVKRRARLNFFQGFSDDIAVTGLTEQDVDLLVYATLSRLLFAVDASSLDPDQGQNERNHQTSSSAKDAITGNSIAQTFWAFYQQGLQQAQARLRREHPPVSHRTF